MTIALIDADIVCYREADAAERKAAKASGAFGAPVLANVDKAIEAAIKTVKEWTSEAECDTTWLIWSPRSRRNFRKELNPDEYKAFRPPKPDCYWLVRDGLEAAFKWVEIEGLEADDVCGILHTSEKTGDTCTVSIDKDFLTIPGRHYNPNKHKWPICLSAQEATWNWFYQTLIGDAADGYKGAPGVGPKGATVGLTPPDSEVSHLNHRIETNICDSDYLDHLWTQVTDLFRAKISCDDEADRLALLNAQVARILHREDYCAETGTIRLWHPTAETPDRLRLSDFTRIPPA